MTRVFQFEERLKSAFSTADRPVVIVVDDADRAGEDGMVFLETLRTFLNNNNFINPIVVIVPQSRYAFDTKSVSRGIRSIDRAMKLYDTTIYFYPQVSGYDFEKYYKNLKINDEYAIKQLTRISSILAGDYGMKRIGYDGQINLRLFKYALRESALFLEYYPKAKLHLAFIFILSRLITTPENEPAASKLKNREFDDHWLLPFMVAIYDEEGKWKPGEVYHYLIFFGDYGKDKEIKIKVYGKTVEINIDKKYEQLIDLP